MEESESVDRDYGGVVKEDESGWKLYYSEEGYPYYYNESTGDSRWAEYDESSYSQQNQPQSETWYDQNQYEYKPQASPGKTYDPRFHSEYRPNAIYEDTRRTVPAAHHRREEEPYKGRGDEEAGEDSESEEESDDEESDESSESEDKEEMDKKFKEYLRTPEGIAAVLYEQERIERMIQKKQEKQSIQRDAEYVKSLLVSKKSDGDVEREDNKARVINQPMNVFDSIRDGFNVYLKGLIDPAERAEKAEQKLKKKIEIMDAKNRSSKAITTSEETTVKSRKNREGKKETLNITIPRDIEDPVEEGDDGNNGEQSVSKSSSSSDLVSLSSEDSDVAVINAPVFAEFGPFLNRFYNTYVEPTRQYLDESGISANTAAAANLILVSGRHVAYNVATASYAIATGIFSLGGTLLQQGLTATGQQLYPHLVSFMENVIDGGNVQPSPQQITDSNTSTRLENTTGDIHYTSSTLTKEENIFSAEPPPDALVENVSYSTLPPAVDSTLVEDNPAANNEV